MARLIKLDTASKRYAYALYSLAEKNKKTEEVQTEFSNIMTVFNSLSEWTAIVENPAIDHNQRANSFLKGVATFNPIKELENFFKVLVERNRTIFLKDIYKEFMNIYNVKKNIEVIEISSAVKLTKEHKTAIEKFIKSEKDSIKEVEFVESEDKDLISGFKFMFDSKIYDTSMLGKLEKMKRTLK